MGFVGDRVLIGLAGALVVTWRRSDKVGDVDGLPGHFLRVWIVYLGCELDGWIPHTIAKTIEIILLCASE